eukprot:5196562-Pleurochrysis_carterae.AAC.1
MCAALLHAKRARVRGRGGDCAPRCACKACNCERQGGRMCAALPHAKHARVRGRGGECAPRRRTQKRAIVKGRGRRMRAALRHAKRARVRGAGGGE